jgi:putative membrane protein
MRYGMDMGWMWLFGLLLLAGLVLLVVLIVRLLGGGPDRNRPGQAPYPTPYQAPYPSPGQPPYQNPSEPPAQFLEPTAPNQRAREILAERYAAGEIDAAEYEERLRRIREG